jgi:hypothetical protein
MAQLYTDYFAAKEHKERRDLDTNSAVEINQSQRYCIIQPGVGRAADYLGKSSHRINSFSHRMGEDGRRPDEGCQEKLILDEAAGIIAGKLLPLAWNVGRSSN